MRKAYSPIESADAQFISIGSGLEEELDNDLNLKKVKESLLHLSADQQDVLIMKFVQDLTHSEIAAVMKKSEGAVRLIQHRGIHALKQIVSANPEPETA